MMFKTMGVHPDPGTLPALAATCLASSPLYLVLCGLLCASMLSGVFIYGGDTVK